MLDFPAGRRRTLHGGYRSGKVATRRRLHEDSLAPGGGTDRTRHGTGSRRDSRGGLQRGRADSFCLWRQRGRDSRRSITRRRRTPATGNATYAFEDLNGTWAGQVRRRERHTRTRETRAVGSQGKIGRRATRRLRLCALHTVGGCRRHLRLRMKHPTSHFDFRTVDLRAAQAQRTTERRGSYTILRGWMDRTRTLTTGGRRVRRLTGGRWWQQPAR